MAHQHLGPTGQAAEHRMAPPCHSCAATRRRLRCHMFATGRSRFCTVADRRSVRHIRVPEQRAIRAKLRASLIKGQLAAQVFLGFTERHRNNGVEKVLVDIPPPPTCPAMLWPVKVTNILAINIPLWPGQCPASWRASIFPGPLWRPSAHEHAREFECHHRSGLEGRCHVRDPMSAETAAVPPLCCEGCSGGLAF